MITDYQILGIEETEDLSLIKSAFRKRAKELHPDTSLDSTLVKNHFLFVEVCKAYERLLNAHAKKKSPKKVEPIVWNDIPSIPLAKHRDPAYVFYKNGVRLFSQIHPSQWNIDTVSMPNTKVAGDEKDQEIVERKVRDLVSLFPKAYYYLSIVVNEYPDSIWSSDARDKMNLIEERIGRYRHIIESFAVWSNLDKNKKEKYRNMLRENRKRYDDFPEVLRREWEKK